MNVDDIIRKLQCCGNQMYSCTDKRCKAKTLGDAVDLINRQKAEIERLTKENEQAIEKWHILEKRTKERYAELYEEAKEVVRVKAIKEFAERLKNNIDLYRYVEEYYVNAEIYFEVRQDLFIDEINNLVK